MQQEKGFHQIYRENQHPLVTPHGILFLVFYDRVYHARVCLATPTCGSSLSSSLCYKPSKTAPNLHNLVSHQREPWLFVASSKCVRFVLSLVRFSDFADKDLQLKAVQINFYFGQWLSISGNRPNKKRFETWHDPCRHEGRAYGSFRRGSKPDDDCRGERRRWMAKESVCCVIFDHLYEAKSCLSDDRLTENESLPKRDVDGACCMLDQEMQ